MRIRITVRGLGIELRGFMDELTDEDAPTLWQLAEALKPFGMVIASLAEPDYNPFKEQEARELHHFETEQENTSLRAPRREGC